MLGALLSDPGIEVGHRRRRVYIFKFVRNVFGRVFGGPKWSCDFLTGECNVFSDTWCCQCVVLQASGPP